MSSLDLNIASRLHESRSAHADGFHAITWRTSSRQASRRSRIEIACCDPVNWPRPTFARDRLHPAYSNKVADNELRVRYLRATRARRDNAAKHLLVVRDWKSNNNWKYPFPSPGVRYFERGDTQKVENAEHYKRHALTFSLYYFYFFVPSILTSLMGYRSKCCYTRDTSHR